MYPKENDKTLENEKNKKQKETHEVKVTQNEKTENIKEQLETLRTVQREEMLRNPRNKRKRKETQVNAMQRKETRRNARNALFMLCRLGHKIQRQNTNLAHLRKKHLETQRTARTPRNLKQRAATRRRPLNSASKHQIQQQTAQTEEFALL